VYSSRTRVHMFKDSDSSPFVRTRTRMQRTRTRTLRTRTRTWWTRLHHCLLHVTGFFMRSAPATSWILLWPLDVLSACIRTHYRQTFRQPTRIASGKSERGTLIIYWVIHVLCVQLTTSRCSPPMTLDQLYHSLKWYTITTSPWAVTLSWQQDDL